MVTCGTVDALWELGRADRAAAASTSSIRSCRSSARPTRTTRSSTSIARTSRSASRATCSSARPQRLAAMELEGVEWSDWGRPERIETVLALRRSRALVPAARSRHEPVSVATRTRRSGRCMRSGARRSGRAGRIRSARTFDGYGTNFAVFSASPSASSCACSTRGDRDARRRSTLRHRPDLARVPAGGRPGHALRLSRPRPVGSGARACAAIRTSCSSIRTRARSARACSGARRCTRTSGDPIGAMSTEDSAPHTFRSVVVQPYFDWGNDRRLEIPWNETVIYEAHVKGLTMRHPDVPAAPARHVRGPRAPGGDRAPQDARRHRASSCCRSTRSCTTASCSSAACATTGATLDRLLRAASRVRERAQRDRRGRRVQAHGARAPRAGIEVILDVVYNHTAEGNHMGPHAVDARPRQPGVLPRSSPIKPGYYMDYTGTGNTLHMRHPHVLQLVMDSLRYWVEEMHVDGFRFDLAAALARGLHEVDRLGAFFDLIQQDPVVSRVKLIAEPWDVGEGGYQVGNFPPLWSEWNGKYRDWIRDYWRGEPGSLPELGSRFTGSSRPLPAERAVSAREHQLRHRARRLHAARPRLVQREAQRGERRGHATARPTTDRGTAASRARPTIRRSTRCAARQQRNFLATLFLSQGVPMLLGGDELGRTQRGNNNALLPGQRALVVRLGARRSRAARVHARARRRSAASIPVFRRRGWFQGRPIRPHGNGRRRCPTSRGSRPTASEMDGRALGRSDRRGSLQVFLNGARHPRARRARRADRRRHVPHRVPRAPEDRVITLPDARWGTSVDARARHRARVRAPTSASATRPARTIAVLARSLWVLRRESVMQIEPRATYRLQLHAGFTFADARRAVPYLAELGISHLYLSPILQAAAGLDARLRRRRSRSRQRRARRRGRASRELVDAAHAAGLGILLDIVPNHMSIAGPTQPLVARRARERPASYYAHFFDVDWTVGDDRVLLPVLGERYGRAIQSGRARDRRDREGAVRRPRARHASCRWRRARSALLVRRAADRARHAELAFIGERSRRCRRRTTASPSARRRRHRDKAVLLAPARRAVRRAAVPRSRSPTRSPRSTRIRSSSTRCSRPELPARALERRGEPALVSPVLRHHTLVGVRNEDADVFDASHARSASSWLRRRRDRRRARRSRRRPARSGGVPARGCATRAPDAWIVVEKILTAGEALPASWPVDGTTGYEFVESVGGCSSIRRASAR